MLKRSVATSQQHTSERPHSDAVQTRRLRTPRRGGRGGRRSSPRGKSNGLVKCRTGCSATSNQPSGLDVGRPDSAHPRSCTMHDPPSCERKRLNAATDQSAEGAGRGMGQCVWGDRGRYKASARCCSYIGCDCRRCRSQLPPILAKCCHHLSSATGWYSASARATRREQRTVLPQAILASTSSVPARCKPRICYLPVRDRAHTTRKQLPSEAPPIPLPLVGTYMKYVFHCAPKHARTIDRCRLPLSQLKPIMNTDQA